MNEGSKVSSLLNVIYCNEIPLLGNLVNSELYQSMTNDYTTKLTKNIDHSIIQYIDDSTNLVSSNDCNELQIYINKYFKILETYYNCNKLLINADKTKLMITCKARYRNDTCNLFLQAKEYIIKQSDKVKVLGIFFTSGLTHMATINNVI